MFLIKTFLLSIFSLVTCTAMHNQRQLQPWVQTARDIHVKTSLKLINAQLGINDNSTILDVKRSIDNFEGIDVEKQSLYTLYKSGILALKETVSEELANCENVKNIMNLYNSRNFLLVIHLNGPLKG